MDKLLAGKETKEVWTQAINNELGRLASGYKKNIKGTNTQNNRYHQIKDYLLLVIQECWLLAIFKFQINQEYYNGFAGIGHINKVYKICNFVRKVEI